MIIESYFKSVTGILEKIKDTQKKKIEAVSKMVADVLKKDGIIYMFGCGHSHLIALDCFYRAGGLANVSAVLDTDLMLHNGAAKSSAMEKMSNIAENIFERYCITDKDLLFIISTSGKNAVPVEMGIAARKEKIKTVAITSSDYFTDKNGGAMLFENCDVYIDNCVPHGDAVIALPNSFVNMGSVSTIASTFIMQTVLAEGAKSAIESGADVPVYMSGNVDGGTEFNKTLIKKYMGRIKHL